MKKSVRFGAVALSSIFLASCIGGNSTEQAERNFTMENKPLPDSSFIPKEVNVVSVGDSLTEGVGDSTGLGGYVPILEKNMEMQDEFSDVEIINFGKRGNRSDQLLKRLKEEEPIRTSIMEADSVIVTIGGNDVMKVFRSNFPSLSYGDFSAALVQYEDRLTNIFSEVRSVNPDASIVLMGIYNPFFVLSADIQEMELIVEEWNNSAKAIAGQWDNTSFVEVSDLFASSQENLLHTDYFHPNDIGYSLIAERIEEALTGILLQAEE
ncbi:SGNH/GDSL hydrolase family protein [Jeotgalibacillus sp. ET6]|uniref:SGNH/GDSL hydrolase family protein n=1 Tax=Jeotgalibacillus sp. ET6 TaxID=3037260 RepID=UPI002418A213|nr:SGNH/GDSL hydrolase family protein [Jeotgalibacillus sp. ET6]MDG5470571.1 SGNH/GDSL hydrolase family protein [Jeotgalibacillus sp. ET6]